MTLVPDSDVRYLAPDMALRFAAPGKGHVWIGRYAGAARDANPPSEASTEPGAGERETSGASFGLVVRRRAAPAAGRPSACVEHRAQPAVERDAAGARPSHRAA